MPFIPPEEIQRAKQIDLLTYLQTYEPHELKQVSGNTYCLKSHDSLRISNGKWYWLFSRGFGGYNALDYLTKVKELKFIDAVKHLLGQAATLPPVFASDDKPLPEEKVFVLPPKYRHTKV